MNDNIIDIYGFNLILFFKVLDIFVIEFVYFEFMN